MKLGDIIEAEEHPHVPLALALRGVQAQRQQTLAQIDGKKESGKPIYQTPPMQFSSWKVFLNFDQVAKYVIFSYSVDDPRCTKEEAYILKEIRSDHKMFQKRMLLLCLTLKTTAMIVGGRHILNMPITFLGQAVMFGTLSYIVSLDSLNDILMASRFAFYLRLMQMGEDYKTGKDTIAMCNYLLSGTYPLDKELRMVVDLSLPKLMMYNRDKATMDDGTTEEGENWSQDDLLLLVDKMQLQQEVGTNKYTERSILTYILLSHILYGFKRQKELQTQAALEKKRMLEEYEELYSFMLEKRLQGGAVPQVTKGNTGSEYERDLSGLRQYLKY